MRRARGTRKQAAIAARAGIDPSVYSNYERGKVPNVSLATVMMIADALDVPLWVLVPETAAPPALVETEKVVWLPVVAEDVAAGLGTWPTNADVEWVPFRRDWKSVRNARDRRYVLFRLGSRSVADSMLPDMKPGALLLADRDEGARSDGLPPQGRAPCLCCLDREAGTVAVKDVQVTRRAGGKPRQLVLQSRNAAYDPVVVDLTRGESILEVVRARVLWWGTEAG